MTTAAQVKKLVKPFLDRRPDLALVKRLIVMKPIHHVLRGILIDGTSNPNSIRPTWLADHFFEPGRDYYLNWSRRIPHTKGGFWDCTQDDVQEVLGKQIELHGLPHIAPLVDLPSFVDFVSRNYMRHHLFDYPERKIVLEVALGNLDAARMTAREKAVTRPLDDPRLDDEDREHLRKVKALCALLEADDRQGMARMLHEWEEGTVRNLKLEHLWEPTPFPLEEV